MTAKIQIRRDTTANWASGNPALAAGEVGYDTTLGQVKVGDGSTTWTSLGWLNGTLPVYASPSSNDLNHATNQLPGVYRFSTVTGMSNVPAAPIDIKAADGGITMLVVKVGSVLVQQLWTDADGSQPAKTYSRVYDGTWKSWTAQSAWAVDATEGVDLIAKSIDLKGTATIAGVASFAAGTAGSPAITRTGDADTGVYFPAANSVSLSSGGLPAVTADGLQKVTLHADVEIGGNLNMTTGTISNVVNPSNAQDAATKNYLEINRVGQTAIVTCSATSVPQDEVIGSSWTTTPTVFINSTSGTGNIRCPAGQSWRGIIIYGNGSSGSILITDSACTNGDGGTIGNAGAVFSMVLLRTT